MSKKRGRDFEAFPLFLWLYVADGLYAEYR